MIDSEQQKTLDAIRDAIHAVQYLGSYEPHSRDYNDAYTALIGLLQEGRRSCPDAISAIWAGDTERFARECKKTAANTPERIENAMQELETHKEYLHVVIKYGIDGVVPEQDAKQTEPPAADDAANPEVRANYSKLFPGGKPKRADIEQFVIRMDQGKGEGVTQLDVGREITGETIGNDAIAQSLISYARKLRKKGELHF